ncbi:MAG: fasciclin domain-containing protein [Bacteroidetes bacterium]|nr:fasciclin domain-containing protein [Bacteroidota bacterium]
MKQTRTVFIILFTGTFLFTSCKKEMKETGFFDENVLSISTFLEHNKEEYSKFWEVIQNAGLYHTLNAFNPHGDGFTLFLPSDEAFERYVQKNDKYGSFEELLSDYDFLWLLSRYHLVNQSLLSSEFPYGSLPDTTATGDYLTIGIEIVGDSSHFTVNNMAPVTVIDIETTNGYIQVIDEVLEPISYNSYQWLKNTEGYTILSSAFEMSGLIDTMDIYRLSSSGQLIKNGYTVFAEHDSIYEREGILSFDDLLERYHTPGYELDDPEGGLYQFAAYHLLEGRYFLDAFQGSSNYNSYAVYPVYITSKLDIRINPGVDSFRFEISGNDTTLINYIGIYFQESNVNTKNGPVHFITEVLELYQPGRSTRSFQFREEPLIIEYSRNVGRYEFVDHNLLELLRWDGPEELVYVKSAAADDNSWSDDYIELDGSFTFEYDMPKIMPGRYLVEIRCDAYGKDNATIRVYIDDKRMGGNLNLTSGGNSINSFDWFGTGIIEFTKYEAHTLKINSLIPGKMGLDIIRFTPE